MTAGFTYRYRIRPLTTKGGKEREEQVEKSRKRRHSDTESSIISGSTYDSSSVDTEGDFLSSSTSSSTSIGQKKKAKKARRGKRLRQS